MLGKARGQRRDDRLLRAPVDHADEIVLLLPLDDEAVAALRPFVDDVAGGARGGDRLVEEGLHVGGIVTGRRHREAALLERGRAGEISGRERGGEESAAVPAMEPEVGLLEREALPDARPEID